MGSVSYAQGRLAAALSCFGLMADLYDFGIINLVRPVLEAEFGRMTPSQDALLTGAALGGAVLGQLGFGAAADYMGRRGLFIATAALVGAASVGSACAGSCPSLGFDVYAVLALWRFLMGLGIGGEYPLAAASTVENTDAASSGRALAVVFAGMALGQLLAPSVVLLMAGRLGVAGPQLWRYAFGVGAVLALLVALLRFAHLRETQGWLEASAKAPLEPEEQAVAQAPHKFAEKLLALLAMKRAMAGTMGSWFIFDVVTYGTGLYSTTIFPVEPGIASATVVLYINLLTLPGFIGAIFLVTRAPMRQIQISGLAGMAMCFVLLVVLFHGVNRSGMVFLSIFSCQRCLDAMGPGVATFIVPAQIFPTRIRGTAHGISAAAGKLGAVLGTMIFPHLKASAGLQVVMAFMAAMSALAAAWTALFTPLYEASTLEAIASLDSSLPLVEQAAMAESLLFGAGRKKGESTSLVPGMSKSFTLSHHGQHYGAAVQGS